jgi:hypothetical protein
MILPYGYTYIAAEQMSQSAPREPDPGRQNLQAHLRVQTVVNELIADSSEQVLEQR